MNCPVCDESTFARVSTVGGRAAMRCQGCGCVALDALPAQTCCPTAAVRPSGSPRCTSTRSSAADYRGGPLLAAVGDLSTAPGTLAPSAFDAAILLDRLHTAPDPAELLRAIHAALRPGAPLLLTTPFARRRTRARPEDRWCFDESTIQLLLLRHGFHEVLVRKTDGTGMLVTAVWDQPRPRPKCSIVDSRFQRKPDVPPANGHTAEKGDPRS